MSNQTKEILEAYRLDKQYLEELSNDTLKMREKNLNTKIGFNEVCNNMGEMVSKLSNRISKIENVINSVSQPYKNVLYYKYVKNLSHTKIAMKMDYSLQRIFQLQKEAINKFAIIYNNID